MENEDGRARGLRLVAQVFAERERSDRPRRPRSIRPSDFDSGCRRKAWLRFRWVGVVEEFEGRMLRLFDRGHREEEVFTKELKSIGAKDMTRDPDDAGKQIGFSTLHGHVNGFLDGVAWNMPGSTADEVVVEFKTHSSKSFKQLEKDGVKKAKPAHWSQMQVYMGEFELEEAFYMAVNKDTDALYGEYVAFDAAAYSRMMDDAEELIFGCVAPLKVSHDPNYFLCRMCTERESCQRNQEPAKNCRTCEYSRPATDDDKAIAGIPDTAPYIWVCEHHGKALTIDDQVSGCGDYQLDDYLRSEIGC